MASPQALSEPDRRIVAAWAADCAERALWIFEADVAGDDRPRDAIRRARAFARGELSAADQIRKRFLAGRAAHPPMPLAAADAARAAAQAAAVAHMGAHALGAAAYAARAVGRAVPDQPDATDAEVRWQLEHMTAEVSAALGLLPPLGQDPAGPLGSGLLARGQLAGVIGQIQAHIRPPS